MQLRGNIRLFVCVESEVRTMESRKVLDCSAMQSGLPVSIETITEPSHTKSESSRQSRLKAEVVTLSSCPAML